MICFVYVLLLLLSFTNIHSQSVNSDNNDKWRPGYPFPEMSRFLNSDSRVHHQPITKASAARPTYSLLEYICSIANENEHVEEILLIFGEEYRSLIETIIKQDCPNNNKIRDKRTTININQNNYPRVLFHKYRRLYSNYNQ